MITQTELKELLHYDLNTGLFTRIGKGRHKCGTIKPNGYLAIHIKCKYYLAHRLAWLYVHGGFPEGDLDHINADRSDNRIKNLREATKHINNQNRHTANKNNRTGLLGVCAHRDKFRATIKIGGKCVFLGYFVTPEEAHAAYVSAKRKHHAGCTL